MRTITISNQHQNNRADLVLAEEMPGFSRSNLKKLFDNGFVFLDGKPIKQSQKVKAGDRMAVDDTLLNIQPPSISLPIIYEDKDVIVINKPPGVLTHSKGALNDEATVATFIKPKIDESIDSNRAGIVHRLDRATSGVIICAKNQASKSYLQKQFSQRTVKKVYLAVVTGFVEPKHAVIDAPIIRNPKNPKKFIVGADGRSAQTEYSVISEGTSGRVQYSILELKPFTGRTHQLRVHLNYIKHPIVGDIIYGKQHSENMLLHALSLEISLPDGARKIFKADLPSYFSQYTK